MSLDRLPTEIDEQIVAHLQRDCDRRAVIYLSQTSRSYYKIACPALYQDIVVQTDESWRLIYLLRTLLECPEHALLIRSIRFTKSTTPFHPSIGKNLTISPVLGDLISQENRDGLKRLINVHTINQVDASFAKDMFNHIIESSEVSYGVLALILSISVNVETIILTPGSDVKFTVYTCLGFFSRHWNYVQDLLYFFRLDTDSGILNRQVQQHAFGQLKTLTICADNAASGIMFIPPCLETLHLLRFCSAQFYQLDPSRNALHTVHLEHGHLAQNMFVDSLERGAFSHVHTLHIKYIELWDEGSLYIGEEFETRILKAIQDHIPDLRAFEWVETPLPRLARNDFRIDSFKNLEHLVLDCERIE